MLVLRLLVLHGIPTSLLYVWILVFILCNYVQANTKYFAMLWESAGGGAFAVIPNDVTGKLPEIPLVAGHKAPVLDLDWNPFNESLIASCSEDCLVNIWYCNSNSVR